MTKSIPYDFVFDYLPLGIIVKPMFGMHYIYLGKKIMIILRKRDNEPELNGIWVATSKEHHQTLQTNIPELGAFFIDNDERHGNWLFIADDSENLEEATIKVCELIVHGDLRIGRLTEKPPL